jgi:hypothetical protein
MSDAPSIEKPPEAGAPAAAEPRGRAVTLKAILLGLGGAALVAGYANFNDYVVRPGVMIAGDQMPILPLALILLVGAAWNPLAGRLWRRLQFSGRELTVALVVMLVSVWLPGYGVYRALVPGLVRPWTHEPQHPDWQKEQTLERMPDHLFPLAHDRRDPRYVAVYGEFETGTQGHRRRLPAAAVPWWPWLDVMAYWAPLLLLVAIMVGALAILMHRQWSRHEQIPYPLASVYASLIPAPGEGVPSVLRSRLFWFGALLPIIVNGDRWLCVALHVAPWIWHGFWFNADIDQVFPVLQKIGWNGVGWFRFAGMGLAYFVASEIGFSVAFTYMIFGVIAAQYYLASGDVMTGRDHQDTITGAYIAYGAVLLYSGRTYYRAAFARAFRRLRADEDPTAPWAARVLILASVATVWLLTAGFGFDWFIACLYVLALLLFFLVVARVVSETGIPFLQAEMDISFTLVNTLGATLIGPGSLTAMYWLGAILCQEQSTCVSLMPFAANSLKLAERTNVGLRAVVPAALIGIVLALVIGFAAQIYGTYAFGGHRDGTSPDDRIARATALITELDETGRLESAETTHGLAKLALLPENVGNGRHFGFLAFGAIGVIALFLVRSRWPGFLLHPLIFVLWESWPAQVLWFPFLVGWVAKTCVVKYGGGKGYQAGKPFFLGLILGDVMSAAFIIVANLIIYLVNGTSPGSGFPL